jgi:hypothetical protein
VHLSLLRPGNKPGRIPRVMHLRELRTRRTCAQKVNGMDYRLFLLLAGC